MLGSIVKTFALIKFAFGLQCGIKGIQGGDGSYEPHLPFF